MESFVLHAWDRENPLNRASSATAWLLAAGCTWAGTVALSLPVRAAAISGNGDVVYPARVSG